MAKVDERNHEKTALIPPDGFFELKVMPLGLRSALAMFQCVMDTVLAVLKWKTYLVNLCDVVVFSSSIEEHLRRPETVLQAITVSELTLKPEKCHFAYNKLFFLGHVIKKSEVRPAKNSRHHQFLDANRQEGSTAISRSVRLLQAFCRKILTDPTSC